MFVLGRTVLCSKGIGHNCVAPVPLGALVSVVLHGLLLGVCLTIRGYADFAALLWGISAHEAGVLRNRAVENSGFWAEIPVHRDLGQMASELLLLMLPLV